MTTTNASHPTDANDTAAPSRLPLIAALIVGLACAVVLNYFLPREIRLSFLSYLPFYLGLFFFLLYGLLIGAIMFRVGKSVRPAPRGLVLTIGILVVLAIWAGGLYQEYLSFPDTTEAVIRDQIPGPVTPEQLDNLHRQATQKVVEYWETHYPPGGFPGFVMWAATGDPVEFSPNEHEERTYLIPARQQGAGFLFRVVVSLGLLMFSILSQLLDLTSSPTTPQSTTPYSARSESTTSESTTSESTTSESTTTESTSPVASRDQDERLASPPPGRPKDSPPGSMPE